MKSEDVPGSVPARPSGQSWPARTEVRFGSNRAIAVLLHGFEDGGVLRASLDLSDVDGVVYREERGQALAWLCARGLVVMREPLPIPEQCDAFGDDHEWNAWSAVPFEDVPEADRYDLLDPECYPQVDWDAPLTLTARSELILTPSLMAQRGIRLARVDPGPWQWPAHG